MRRRFMVSGFEDGVGGLGRVYTEQTMFAHLEFSSLRTYNEYNLER